MIIEQLSREALIELVLANCTQCKKDCPPFKVGEHYEAYQDADTVTVIADTEEDGHVHFTYEEAEEHFTNSKDE